MAKYYHSDYALNKKSESILYRSADGSVVEITKEDYLQQNPDLTVEQFIELKHLSDGLFNEEKNRERTQQRTKTKEKKKRLSAPPPLSCEEQLIHDEEKEHIREVANQLLDSKTLTETQERRFKKHYVEGLSYRSIAQQEGVHFTSIQECIYACRKKLKKFFKNY